jgi:hypothetical protein
VSNCGEDNRFNLGWSDASFLDGLVAGLNCHIHQRAILACALSGDDSGALSNPFIG